MSRFQNFRLRARLRDLEAWLTSANGDHRPEIDQKAREEIAFLRAILY